MARFGQQGVTLLSQHGCSRIQSRESKVACAVASEGMHAWHPLCLEGLPIYVNAEASCQTKLHYQRGSVEDPVRNPKPYTVAWTPPYRIRPYPEPAPLLSQPLGILRFNTEKTNAPVSPHSTQLAFRSFTV